MRCLLLILMGLFPTMCLADEKVQTVSDYTADGVSYVPVIVMVQFELGEGRVFGGSVSVRLKDVGEGSVEKAMQIQNHQERMIELSLGSARDMDLSRSTLLWMKTPFSKAKKGDDMWYHRQLNGEVIVGDPAHPYKKGKIIDFVDNVKKAQSSSGALTLNIKITEQELLRVLKIEKAKEERQKEKLKEVKKDGMWEMATRPIKDYKKLYEGKTVFFMFGADWCATSMLLLKKLEKLNGVGILGKEVIFVKYDCTDINSVGGKELKAKCDSRTPSFMLLRKNGDLITYEVTSLEEDALKQFLKKVAVDSER